MFLEMIVVGICMLVVGLGSLVVVVWVQLGCYCKI